MYVDETKLDKVLKFFVHEKNHGLGDSYRLINGVVYPNPPAYADLPPEFPRSLKRRVDPDLHLAIQSRAGTNARYVQYKEKNEQDGDYAVTPAWYVYFPPTPFISHPSF